MPSGAQLRSTLGRWQSAARDAFRGVFTGRLGAGAQVVSDRVSVIYEHDTRPVKRGPVDSDGTGLTAVTRTAVGSRAVYAKSLCQYYGRKLLWKTFYTFSAAGLRIFGLPDSRVGSASVSAGG